MSLYSSNLKDIIDDDSNDEYYNSYIYRGGVEINRNNYYDILYENNRSITGGSKSLKDLNSFDNVETINYQSLDELSLFERKKLHDKNNFFKNRLGGANKQPEATLKIPGNLVNVSDEVNKMRPIDYIIQKIKQIKDNQLLPNLMIIKAGTGTGKSFFLPVDIYTNFGNPNIICVQPTVILATKLSTSVAANNPNIFKIGKNIGYLTGNRKSSAKGLVYVTTGILLRILRSMISNLDNGVTDPNDPDFILVDEAHKRPLDIEISLVLLNQLIIRSQKKAPFIMLLSATINVDSLVKYFNIIKDEHLVEVEGSTSVRVDSFIDIDSSNLVTDIIGRIKDIVDKKFDKLLSDAVNYKENKKNIKSYRGGTTKLNYDKLNYDKLNYENNVHNRYDEEEMNYEITDYGYYDDDYFDLYLTYNDLVNRDNTHNIKVNNDIIDDRLLKSFNNTHHIVKLSENKNNENIISDNLHENEQDTKDKRKRVKQHNSNPLEPNDILVFVPTNSFLERLYINLIKWIIREDLPIILIGLTSKAFAEQAEDIAWLDKNIGDYLINGKRIERRIILATNVAETGLTLTMLKHVIETGIVNSVEYNPHYSASCTMLKPTSQDSVLQRIGRVGRNIPGVSHGMYTKDTFKSLKRYNDPDIVKEEFSLEYLALKESNVDYRDLIDKPLTEMVYHIEDKLYCLGFLDNEHNLTTLGKYACKFTTISIESIKMILSGYAFDVCISDLITIAAMLPEIEKLILPTFLPICDQFISALLYFEVALFNDPRGFSDTGLSESGVDINFLRSINLTSKLSEINITKILSTRWDIVKSLSLLGFSLYNVPSHVNELCKFVKEYRLLENMSKDSLIDDKKIKSNPNYTTLCNFKKCIYEGYKLNTIFKQGNSYLTLKGDYVSLPQIYTNLDKNIYNSLGLISYELPNVMIARKFSMELNFKTNKYELKADKVSILDGFIGCDLSFYSMYTVDADRALTNMEYKLYQESLPIGNLSYSNLFVASDISGGMNKEYEYKPIIGYFDSSELYNEL